jgi:organic hydroperoxide reductase OsmC/OhrA
VLEGALSLLRSGGRDGIRTHDLLIANDGENKVRQGATITYSGWTELEKRSRSGALKLQTEADTPGIDNATFQEIGHDSKQKCPVSKALAGTEILLSAKLLTAPAA